MIYLNHPYKCTHCGKPYIILQGKFSWSFIPVELTNEQLKTPSLWEGEWGWAFDKDKHTSHLNNCAKLQAEWPEDKKKILADVKQREKDELKNILR